MGKRCVGEKDCGRKTRREAREGCVLQGNIRNKAKGKREQERKKLGL